ncbi:unnamed protein product [Leptidea sinapis]|uniref:Uncharacterized protein n=1 Tax=Leptidea sinapis TaxID=189913 RepID=A0A5E4QRM1_9NEOP|nr:unnamed protein product [Leptidea sinapis]
MKTALLFELILPLALSQAFPNTDDASSVNLITVNEITEPIKPCIDKKRAWTGGSGRKSGVLPFPFGNNDALGQGDVGQFLVGGIQNPMYIPPYYMHRDIRKFPNIQINTAPVSNGYSMMHGIQDIPMDVVDLVRGNLSPANGGGRLRFGPVGFMLDHRFG